MIKYVKIVPRMGIELLLEKHELAMRKILFNDVSTPWALISVFGLKEVMNDKGGRDKNPLISKENFPILKDMGCVDYANSCFMDITKEQYEKHNRTIYMENMLFDTNRAERIVHFVDKIKDSCVRLIVHCDAGVSRSGAIGLWVTRYLGLDEKKYCDSNLGIKPNLHVVDVLSDVSGIKKDYEQFWMDNMYKLDITWNELF
jgi:protein-tyrosine phosphatase